MSSHSYDVPCPNCGGEMSACTDNRPFDMSSADCPKCGFMYWTKAGQRTLEELNDLRADYDLKPLKKLPKIDDRLKEYFNW
jgi:ssDNA-binding Zn-finger/Zn-ribbon topoisomerase 1